MIIVVSVADPGELTIQGFILYFVLNICGKLLIILSIYDISVWLRTGYNPAKINRIGSHTGKISNSYLERDKISPDARLVGRLDLIVEMVQNDVVDVLVPGQNLSNLTESALTYLHPKTTKKGMPYRPQIYLETKYNTMEEGVNGV